MSVPAEFSEARKEFHAKLLETTLTINGAGMQRIKPVAADRDSAEG